MRLLSQNVELINRVRIVFWIFQSLTEADAFDFDFQSVKSLAKGRYIHHRLSLNNKKRKTLEE